MTSTLDPQNVRGSIEALPDQLADAYAMSERVKVPEEYGRCTRLLCCGMGGSGLGARFIETVYADTLRIPLVRVHGYRLPGFVDEETLVICSSYSGSTEEVLANFDEARRRGAKLLAIAAGSDLIRKAQEAKIPYYAIDPKHNPSNQPRMAVGYSIMGQLRMVAAAGLIELRRADVDEAIGAMRRVQGQSDSIERLARTMTGKVLLLGAAEHLVGPLHTINNQFNENAKTLTFDFSLPELNHHLLEGMKYPETNRENVCFLLIDSPSYDARNRKRLRLTAEVAEKNGIRTIIHEVEPGTRLAEGFALIQFGAYLNYALAMAYGQNPAPIPFVDYFKERLSKNEG